jgi:1-deoxy-D-xylulose-5-phosphate reductoisomerase
MTRGVAILGSTGSIGRSALRVLARHRDRFRVVALTAYGSRDLLLEQADATGADYVCLVRDGDRPTGGREVAVGAECLVDAATHPGADIVINAVVGAAGLRATLAALRAGRRVALANKESLVMAGDLVLAAARDGGGEIVPVDSEHSAVLQCLAGHGAAGVQRLILTASGGPFRSWPAERLHEARVEDALRHPTWDMGRKITVDSATLANKALEVIEAHYLFGLGYDQVDVVVHPQSIVHAFVEFSDRSVLAQVGFPTMELPILYALTHPERIPDDGAPRFDPVAAGALDFESLRRDDFPAFRLGVAAGKAGGTAPAAYNAANEVAVGAFLEERIPFRAIGDVIEGVLETHAVSPAADLETVLAADRWARERGEALCSSP